MIYVKKYENFSIFDTIKTEDRNNFNLIFNSLYKYHLNLNEKNIIKLDYGLITESWFDDLVDKGKRGVLKIKSEAGQLLVDLATKAKEILDFAKQLANKIGQYIKEQFNGLLNIVKNKALKDVPFLEVLTDFLNKKKQIKLKSYINNVGSLIQYIISGKFITDLIDRLSVLFSKVLNLGTNEGLYNMGNDFLFEEADENNEKKSFLQRLGDKIKSFPPFNFIPKIEELMKKGISFLSGIIDKFFIWLENKKMFSTFSKGLSFLFQILEIYIHFKVVGKIEKFKELLNKSSGLEDLTKMIQDKSLDQIWDIIGINGEEIVNKVKNSIKKIPYVGDFLSILDTLVIAIGSYLAIKPTLDKLV